VDRALANYAELAKAAPTEKARAFWGRKVAERVEANREAI
jgi:hypothetical protein